MGAGAEALRWREENLSGKLTGQHREQLVGSLLRAIARKLRHVREKKGRRCSTQESPAGGATPLYFHGGKKKKKKKANLILIFKNRQKKKKE